MKRLFLSIALAVVSLAHPQRGPERNAPIFTVLNAASGEEAFARGSLVTIESEAVRFADGEYIPLDYSRWPLELGGVLVSFDGQGAPLRFVSPNRLLCQVPFDDAMPGRRIATHSRIRLTIETPRGEWHQRVRIAKEAPALYFTKTDAGLHLANGLWRQGGAFPQPITLRPMSASMGERLTEVMVVATGMEQATFRQGAGTDEVSKNLPARRSPGDWRVEVGGVSAEIRLVSSLFGYPMPGQQSVFFVLPEGAHGLVEVKIVGRDGASNAVFISVE